jgi:hypothetical protein
MSVIQDALRKAQGEYVEKKAPRIVKEDATRLKTEVQTSQETKRSIPMRLPALVGIFIGLLLVYGLRLSLQYLGMPEKSAKAPDKVETTAVRQENTAISPSAAKRADSFSLPKMNPVNLITPRPSNFILNGIMYVENKPQAIINGYVLEDGDKINGAIVLAIEKDCVLLDFNDTDIKLELNK